MHNTMDSRIAWSLLVDYPLVFNAPEYGTRMCCWRGVIMSRTIAMALIMHTERIPVHRDLRTDFYRLRVMGAFGDSMQKDIYFDSNEKMISMFWSKFDIESRKLIQSTSMSELLKHLDRQ